MKKITLLSIIAATVLFTGCGEDAKKAASDAATAATETVKETTANAVDATKAAADEAAEAAKAKAAEVAEAAKAKAEKAAAAVAEKAVAAKAVVGEKAAVATDAAKETATKTTEAVKAAASDAPEAAAPSADTAAGKVVFAKCVGCHGADGKTKALGKSGIIAGQSVADLEKWIAGYKAGTRNVAGMGMLMKGQVGGLSDEDIKAVAAYISTL